MCCQWTTGELTLSCWQQCQISRLPDHSLSDSGRGTWRCDARVTCSVHWLGMFSNEWLAHLFQILEWNSVPAIHPHSTLVTTCYNRHRPALHPKLRSPAACSTVCYVKTYQLRSKRVVPEAEQQTRISNFWMYR